MQQILEIHKKNKEQNQNTEDSEQLIDETTPPQEKDQQWLDQKLQKFSGVNDGQDTVGERGQLLEDEQKEVIEVDSASYIKLYALSGGFLTLAILCSF